MNEHDVSAADLNPDATPEVHGDGPPTPPDPQTPASEAPTRRESIEKAFQALDSEAAATENSASPDQPRGPDGKFIAREGAGQSPGDNSMDTSGAKAGDKTDAAPDKSDALDMPPQRFSAEAKTAWADAPAAVKGEIGRAISELEAGLRQKDAQLAPMKPYFDLAKEHGVEVPTVLGNYIRMEQLLAQDVRKGLEAIAQNFGITFDDMIAKATGASRTAPTRIARLLIYRTRWRSCNSRCLASRSPCNAPLRIR